MSGPASGMPSRISILVLLLSAPVWAGWTEVLESAGLDRTNLTLIAGDSAEARAYGFRATAARVKVSSVTDVLQPELQIVWENAEEVPVFEVPPEARVFTRERWSNAPLAAGLKKGEEIILWTAADPGAKGYERFPYLVQALGLLGARPRFEGRHLWAFFDSSYRLRADVDFLAKRWRAAGLIALHVAAWHYWEPDKSRDEWLAKLIEACHRNAILVYAWIEFPHVSEKFWRDHPEWREKTATLEDAHLDWRMLMNLANPDCARAAGAGLESLAGRFDWDGVNLGELYFESLEGYANPARFTPLNDDVRKEFKTLHGVDPIAFFGPKNPHFEPQNGEKMRVFLDYRAALARRLQEEWLARLARLRDARPHLDLVLTHIDDRFDATMRDKLGADASRLLPVAEKYDATFLVEDPATVWHLGPGRYTEIARRYAALSSKPELMAIDINIVERYQDVYPTKQQTGVELFQLVRKASAAFPRVALYFENSILAPDWPWLAASSAVTVSERWDGDTLEVETARPTSVRWSECATVNGRHWPARNGEWILLPVGLSRVESCTGPHGPAPLKDFNGTLKDASLQNGRLTIEYESRTRAIAVLGGAQERVVMLPPGARRVTIDWRN